MRTYAESEYSGGRMEDREGWNPPSTLPLFARGNTQAKTLPILQERKGFYIRMI